MISFKKYLLPTLLGFTTFVTNAQSLILPSLQDLESTLITFIEIERDAKLRTFEELQSATWHDLLPSVGVAYTPTGAPRPSASWSPLQILDRKEKNKKRKLDRQSIILTYEIHLTDRLFKLRQLYNDYGIDYAGIKTKEEVITIDEKLFAITEKKYEENIIKPSEYLKAKKAIVQIRARLMESKQELMKKRNEILYEAKWN